MSVMMAAKCLHSPAPLPGSPLHDKAPICLETVDGSRHEVEWEAAMLFPLVHREVLLNGCCPRDKVIIALPAQVNPSTLKLLLEYCRFHQVPGRSDKERKFFDEKFVRLDTKTLCELTSAADSLDMKPLVDLTSRALARMIEGKTPKEIRETFGLPDDLTEEEKLEPVKNTTDDMRIRLLNRLYARKRKELQDKKLLKEGSIEECKRDERSVDDLVSFIDGDDKGDKLAKSGKAKRKKNRRKKDQTSSKGSCTTSLENDEAENSGRCEDSHHLPEADELGYPDEEDDLDPAMKEELDREVEDFARRLNADWPNRMQEILALASSSNQEHGLWTTTPTTTSPTQNCCQPKTHELVG
ncbi:SKP1-like protein 21 [Selaginella moellendorffii]|uniref:SKP1-like protein 21 n=1 Tax=Selaginella moellendorffii TaxID=88036 RepID=UPI000D1C92DA|nr:SKP1-like protein 21 [Selaginella moellendorffii]|eukprot:XP_002982205.2 SKP1-like protein 21 [Selaginella moellendorffii]